MASFRVFERDFISRWRNSSTVIRPPFMWLVDMQTGNKITKRISQKETFDYLNGQFIIKVAKAELFRPETFAGCKNGNNANINKHFSKLTCQWVNTDSHAHFLKIPTKLGIPAYFLAMLHCELFQFLGEHIQLIRKLLQLFAG